MPQAYFIREAYFTLRSNISLVPQGTNFIEKDDCSRNRLFLFMGYKKDIFTVFACEFEPSQHLLKLQLTAM